MRRRTGDAPAPTRGRDEPNKTPRENKPRFEKAAADKPRAVKPKRAAPVESGEKAFEGERVAKAPA